MVNNDEKLQVIIDYFKTKYKAKVIIIVGSRAVGDFKPKSDWDIYMFTDVEDEHNETFQEFIEAYPSILRDDDIDLYWHSMEIDSYPPKLWRDLRSSKVVLDTSKGFGEKLREKALELYEKGPVKWSKDYAFGRTVKARRYMKKFEAHLADKEYEELFLRISWHYSENIIEWWFGIRQEFPLRPQQAFSYIKEKDLEFYDELQKVVSDKTSYREKVDAFKKIHDLLFNSEEFIQLL
ncbi:MAG: nucleotidyltransferase domain-containing protein [Asgard group archaeon]|nr:nucleotidyltransferase domain-containing protein [Asgard group archaeon]